MILDKKQNNEIIFPAKAGMYLKKYPRTFHFPFSPGKTSDDKVLPDTSHFNGKRIIIQPKYDGENITLYRETLHARSIDLGNHPSRNYIKKFHAGIKHNIPEDWRVCGEYLYAVHSIKYNNLPDYYLVFSIWNENNECLNWDETVEWCGLMGLFPVPVLFDGIWDEDKIKRLYSPMYDDDECEGFVARLFDGFKFEDFSKSVAKYVRKGHVCGNKHWKSGQFEINKVVNPGLP